MSNLVIAIGFVLLAKTLGSDDTFGQGLLLLIALTVDVSRVAAWTKLQ